MDQRGVNIETVGSSTKKITSSHPKGLERGITWIELAWKYVNAFQSWPGLGWVTEEER